MLLGKVWLAKAVEFRSAGFDADETSEWGRYRFEPGEVEAWRSLGFRAAAADQWRRRGWPPNEARAAYDSYNSVPPYEVIAAGHGVWSGEAVKPLSDPPGHRGWAENDPWTALSPSRGRSPERIITPQPKRPPEMKGVAFFHEPGEDEPHWFGHADFGSAYATEDAPEFSSFEEVREWATTRAVRIIIVNADKDSHRVVELDEDQT